MRIQVGTDEMVTRTHLRLCTIGFKLHQRLIIPRLDLSIRLHLLATVRFSRIRLQFLCLYSPHALWPCEGRHSSLQCVKHDSIWRQSSLPSENTLRALAVLQHCRTKYKRCGLPQLPFAIAELFNNYHLGRHLLVTPPLHRVRRTIVRRRHADAIFALYRPLHP